MRLEQAALEQAQQVIGYRFNDPRLLDIALTHASIAESRLASNERMEFLGDAVLGLIVCDYLYGKFPNLLEGDLTKIKSAAVSRRMCARIASDLALDRLLILGKGMKTRASIPPSLSAAVLEAVIGAIYLDGGVEAVRSFLLPLLAHQIDVAASSGHQQNFKSVLQQYAQRRYEQAPVYVLMDEKGPDHAKCFEVAVEVGGNRFEPCWASSKKQAEQQAAQRALEDLNLIVRTEDGQAIYVGDGEAEGEESENGSATPPLSTISSEETAEPVPAARPAKKRRTG